MRGILGVIVSPALRDWWPTSGSFCPGLLTPVEQGWVQNSRAQTLLIDQGIEKKRAHALKHHVPTGKVSRVFMGCEGGGVSTSSLVVGAFGACRKLPLLHSAPFAHESFSTWHPIAILDLSGLDWFCFGSYKQAQLKDKGLDMENVLGTSLGDTTIQLWNWCNLHRIDIIQ